MVGIHLGLALPRDCMLQYRKLHVINLTTHRGWVVLRTGFPRNAGNPNSVTARQVNSARQHIAILSKFLLGVRRQFSRIVRYHPEWSANDRCITGACPSAVSKTSCCRPECLPCFRSFFLSVYGYVIFTWCHWSWESPPDGSTWPVLLCDLSYTDTVHDIHDEQSAQARRLRMPPHELKLV